MTPRPHACIVLRLRSYSWGAALLWLAATQLAWAAGGQLELRTVDSETGEPVAARMHLKDARGKPVKPPRSVAWQDHFVFGGKVVLDLPVGNYTFEIERGPEYKLRTGYFEIKPGASDNKTVELNRFVNMRKEGWWSGDLHVHRAPKDIELLMAAEDLHVAPVITWWNDTNLWAKQPLPEKPLVEFGDQRFYHLLAGEDERGGGALLYFNLAEPLPVAGAKREYPSPVDFLKQAKRQPNAHVDVEKPFWWDMPVWIASRRVDSIGVAHNHLHRDGMMTNEAWGKPRDSAFYPNPHGNARWSLDIYHHLLNCGLRIPPSAGSASGVLPNPVGYNRVYVHCGDEMTWEKWWEGLRLGRVTVTNGPLLRPRVNGELPGYTFQAYDGESVELNIGLNLSLREKVEYLEIIKDGVVAQEVRLSDWVKNNGELPPLKFDRSGWMLVRAVTNNPTTFRYAMTGPYYVQIGDKPRISRKSAQFFVDWIDQRVAKLQLPDAREKEEVIKYHVAARKFWVNLVETANAE